MGQLKKMKLPNVLVSQVGYLCDVRKRFVVPDGAATEFEIQDMTRHTRETLGEWENWLPIFRGHLQPARGAMGDFAVGDFSAVRGPGFYRVVLVGDAGHSYPFAISDGAFARLPRMFLDYCHNQRCGPFENEWRGPCHLDDGVRSDNGAPVDVVGGWHDAGDVRKWMATTPLPVLGLLQMHERFGSENDWLDEAAWGVRFILKMQDPATGMIFEDVGGGGDSRKQPDSSWWSENHAGVYADNEDNRFTDNAPGSGDERRVRVQYNPIVQYTNITILLRAADAFHEGDPAFAKSCADAARRCWQFMDGKRTDSFHSWTSVLSWRLLAALEICKAGFAAEEALVEAVMAVLALQDREAGYWWYDATQREPYRGTLHSAQPVIAVARLIEEFPSHPCASRAADAVRRCADKFIAPMLQTNPFGIMPYALYLQPRSADDVYHDGGGGGTFRFFMPTRSKRDVNHGLAAHWTSWAHGLALAAGVLGERSWSDAAWDQLHWLMGANPRNLSMISGVGYAQAMPYTRFYGVLPGGFCIGPRGDAEDRIYIESDGRCDWSSGEYWMPPLANTLMAFAHLLPTNVDRSRKLGYVEQK